MSIRKIIGSLVFLFIPTVSYATTADNSVFFELGGNAGAYSINYERFLLDQAVSARVGVGSLWVGNYAGVAVPATVSGLWGNPCSNHKFETGLGATYFSADRKSRLFSSRANSTVMGTAIVGYRYLPKENGMTFKAGFTPIFNNDVFIPWLGFSVGHSF